MLALLIPMCLLYEAGIIAASLLFKVKAPEEKSDRTTLTAEQTAEQFAAVEKEQNSGGR